MVSIEQLALLQSPQGSRLLAEVGDLAPTPATAIAVGTRLRKTYPAELVIAAMEMHQLRLRARAKFSRADELWFTRAGLEQATSEPVAAWHAARFAGFEAIADLCCGIGGDLLALGASAPAPAIQAVDRDPLRLHIAALNAEVAGIRERVSFFEADVRDVSLSPRAAVFVDPARRSEQARLAVGESEPPLEWCIELAGGGASAATGRAVGIKCAPGLDRDRAPAGWEFETIALGTDLKEAMLWSPGLAQHRASATVIDGPERHRLVPREGDLVGVRVPAEGETLLDPNPAVTRAGLVEDLARTLGAGTSKIDERIGFLVTSAPVATPFARPLRIVASLPWNERRLRSRLQALDAGPVDIRRRGLAGDVDAIAARLRGKGDVPFLIAMTRVIDQPWALVCTAASTTPGAPRPIQSGGSGATIG